MSFPRDACKTSRHFLVCLVPALLASLCTKSLGIMEGDPAQEVLYLVSGVFPGCVNTYLGICGAIDATDELRYMSLILRTSSSVAAFHMMIQPSNSDADFCFGIVLTILIVFLLMFMQAHLNTNKIDVASTKIDAILVVIFSGVKLVRAHLDNGDGQLACAVLFLLPAFSAVVLGVSMAVRSARAALLEWQVRYVEANFDAAFFVNQPRWDTNLRIASRSEKLDRIFKHPMEGQVLNDLTVVHGLESLEKLNPSMRNKTCPQPTSTNRMVVTCIDATGLEFDCELCSRPANHQDGFLVGLRVIGEKRPHEHGARTETVYEDEATTEFPTKRKHRRIPTVSSVGEKSDMEGLESPEVEYVSEATTKAPAPIMRKPRRLLTGTTASDYGENWTEQELDGASETTAVLSKKQEVLMIPRAAHTAAVDNDLSPISEASTRKAFTFHEEQLVGQAQSVFGSGLRAEVLTAAPATFTSEHRSGILRRRNMREINSSDMADAVSWPLQRLRKAKPLKSESIVDISYLPWWADWQDQFDQDRKRFLAHGSQLGD